MATRYEIETLLQLRESPLCTKPNTLPPVEEWMGPPPETTTRSTQAPPRIGTERTRNDNALGFDSFANRRPGLDRHLSRNNANPEDIVLGPPRNTFFSSTVARGGKLSDGDKATREPVRDSDGRDRFGTFRRNGDGDSDRFRDGNKERERERPDRDRDGKAQLRRRGDTDQDSDGWSTVKPRKSFGHEGAERFHGRMGDRPDRFGGEQRRNRDNNEDDNDRAPRRHNIGDLSRDKEIDDGERPRRNGLNRHRTDQPSWSGGGGNTVEHDAPPPTRKHFDRAKSWRERDRADEPEEGRHRERLPDRRWDRDHRQERDPEWMEESADEKPQVRTAEDFQKFMESMKASKTSAAKGDQPSASILDPQVQGANLENEKSKVRSAPAAEIGPDKFFANFTPTPSAVINNPLEIPKESAAPKSKMGSSRFQNFFSSQEDRDRRQTEPPTPAAGPPSQEPNPLLAMISGIAKSSPAGPPGLQNDVATEKIAFQALLQKLQKSSVGTNTPPSEGFSAPPPSHDMGSKGFISSPGPFPPYGQERRDEPHSRGPPPQEILQRHQQPPQLPPMHPEQQLLQQLIGQRHAMASQGSGRGDQNQSRNSNSNAEFLMGLMQGSRNGPDRAEQHIRMPQPSRPAQIPQTPDRELDHHRERSASQHQGRPQGLPGFFDEPQLHHHEQENRRQPPQILQRQIPPGLDQVHPNWMQGGNQQLPPGPGRPMIAPPPGLIGNPRNVPMPANFPPNFPMGNFPPETMGGPPRNVGPPPGFFGGPGGPPPPGFMPPVPPGMAPGFHGGPEPLAFGFDGRGMPPPGAGGFRRN